MVLICICGKFVTGDGHIGLKWHTKTETFAENVVAFCPTCKEVELVSRGNRKNVIIHIYVVTV